MAFAVRAFTVLLCAALAGLYLALGETRFALAAAAIACLVEIALALRARAGGRGGRSDPSRMAATGVSYADHDGVLAVTLSGSDGAPSLVLSRNVRPPPDTHAPACGPRLDLSRPKGAIQAGIRDAYLSPQLLRLAVDTQSAQALGAETVCITLPAGTDQRLLERALGRILRGVPFTSDRSVPEEEAEAGIASRVG